MYLTPLSAFRFRQVLSLGLMLLLLSCSTKFRKIQKNEDWRIKYEAALNYYEKKDFYHASVLFEDIRPIVRGLPEGEDVEFSLAYCHYNEGNYILAAESFKSFYEVYGRSQHAQESSYMYAYSLYASAPPSNLDQESGREAMDAMQNFLNRYPDSEFTERAIEVINVSQSKLEEKAFTNAKLYLRVKNYKAAVIALKNFSQDYPDTQLLEESSFLRVDAQFKLATMSMPNLQAERYNTVVEFYLEFVDKYPNSKYLKDAEKIYVQSLSKINQFKKNKTA
jgi:outer membrane protein assembly factor BamD